MTWRDDMENAPRRCIIFDKRWGVTEALRFDGGRWGMATFNGQIIQANPEKWQPLPTPPTTDKPEQEG
jgi:hypothetical protein